MELLGGEFLSISDSEVIKKTKKAELIIFVYHDQSLIAEVGQKIREFNKKVKIVWWYYDYRKPVKKLDLSFLDALFLCHREMWPRYKKENKIKKIYYLPQGAPIKNIERIKMIEPIKWDAMFIGSLKSGCIEYDQFHNHREKLIKKISKKHKVEIRNSYEQGNRNLIELNSNYLYKFSPFSLCSSKPFKGYNSNRLYNILSVNGFCLTNYFPGIEKLFENHKHLTWFKTTDEAIEIMDYYLANPAKHWKIKQAGYREFLKNHTCVHRILEIIKTICN